MPGRAGCPGCPPPEPGLLPARREDARYRSGRPIHGPREFSRAPARFTRALGSFTPDPGQPAPCRPHRGGDAILWSRVTRTCSSRSFLSRVTRARFLRYRTMERHGPGFGGIAPSRRGAVRGRAPGSPETTAEVVGHQVVEVRQVLGGASERQRYRASCRREERLLRDRPSARTRQR